MPDSTTSTPDGRKLIALAYRLWLIAHAPYGGQKGAGPAFVVGNSMGAATAVIAAAERAEMVRGLVLLGPFVREPHTGWITRIAMRVLVSRWWARPVWASYLPKLYAGRRPDDFETHRNAIIAALRKPGHTTAFCRTTRTSHAPAQARIDQVTAPCLVMMGELDPDFRDPTGEAAWIAERLGDEVLLIPHTGHYPQAQRPDVVAPAIVAFLQKVDADA